MEGALAQMGEGPMMMPASSLSVVSGMPGVIRWPTKEQQNVANKFDVDGLWDLVKKAESSPVVFQSVNSGAKAVSNQHAWAVMGGSDQGGRKMCVLCVAAEPALTAQGQALQSLGHV